MAPSIKTFGYDNEDLIDTCDETVRIMSIVGFIIFVIEYFWFILYGDWNNYQTFIGYFFYFLGYLLMITLFVILLKNYRDGESSVKLRRYSQIITATINFTLLLYAFNPWITEFLKSVDEYGMYKMTILFQYVTLPVYLMIFTFYSFLDWKTNRILSDYDPRQVVYGGEDNSEKKLIKNL